MCRPESRVTGPPEAASIYFWSRKEMNIDLEQEKLNKATEKIVKKLNTLKTPIGFHISEWLRDRTAPYVNVSFIDFNIFVDLREEIENKTNEEVYILIYNKLIIRLEELLGGLKTC